MRTIPLIASTARSAIVEEGPRNWYDTESPAETAVTVPTEVPTAAVSGMVKLYELCRNLGGLAPDLEVGKGREFTPGFPLTPITCVTNELTEEELPVMEELYKEAVKMYGGGGGEEGGEETTVDGNTMKTVKLTVDDGNWSAADPLALPAALPPPRLAQLKTSVICWAELENILAVTSL